MVDIMKNIILTHGLDIQDSINTTYLYTLGVRTFL